MLDAVWIVVALPALSFLVILFFGKRMPKGGAGIGILAVGASFVLSCVTAAQWIDRVNAATGKSEGLGAFFGKGMLLHGGEHTVVTPVVHHITWWQSGGSTFGVGTYVDGLTVLMLFVVTIISLLVHIYSTAYMKGDHRFTWFYACLSLFTASMLLLVVADNTLEMLVGWELVGLCSFMLIGFWWEDPANSRAAIKAFLTTRTGDIGLMIGVIILFFTVGSFGITATNLYATGAHAQHDLMLAASVCLMIAIMGKSGQFPLHTWLPDAMAGPTPVSALIHAATMVVAGVFLGARLYPVFYNGFSIGNGGVNMMALIGGVTILIGAVLAFVQQDIKKVLAYSTISQLGYMVMALGVGAWAAAVFHLFTHAFFKALLFLGAGSVSHGGTHHSFDMREMGGLRKPMPITFWTFLIGSLALAGIFPLAGFWSKDEILVTAGSHGFDAFLVIGLIGAFLTAAYMTRCVYLTFFGEYRGTHHPHESERAITIPLVILAVFSVFAGLVNAAPLGLDKFAKYIEPTFAFPDLGTVDFDYPKAIISVTIAVVAIGIAAFYWFRREEELGALKGLTQRNKVAHAGYTFLENKYYLDYLYEDIIVEGIRTPIANASYWVNQHVIDGVVNGAGRGAKAAGRVAYDTFDQRVVDGAVNGLAYETGVTGEEVRRFQTGQVQRYALVLFAAVGLLSLALFLTNVVEIRKGYGAMDWFDDWALTLAVFVPLVGMALVLLIPRAHEQAIKATALITAIATGAVGVGILADFDYDRSGTLQFQVNKPWIPLIHSRYHLGIDGISLPLLILSMLMVILCIIYSWNHFPEPHNPKAFLALILLLTVGMNGTFVAQDLILFFIFFELVLLPMFFMIGVWGGPNREYASIKFFLFTLFGSALMLVGFLAIFFLSKVHTFDMVTLSRLGASGITEGTQILVFAGLFLGFAIKVPMFPFHTWLPDAHTEAPTVGSVLLAAIMLKLGTYGFIRIALPILPKGAENWAPWIGLLAVIGIIYGALCCLAQSDMKRLIAFSSVSHMGFVMLGIATLTSFGLNAAVFGMVAHGFITGMLFFVAGSVQERYKTREMSRLGGLLTQAPKLGWILGFCAMASLGLPGLAGFWGEFPAVLSAYSPAKLADGLFSSENLLTYRTYMVIAAIGTVLAAGYLLWMLQRVAFGKVKPEFEHAHIHDVHVSEWIAWTPLLVFIVVLGIYPDLLFSITDGAVSHISRAFGG